MAINTSSNFETRKQRDVVQSSAPGRPVEQQGNSALPPSITNLVQQVLGGGLSTNLLGAGPASVPTSIQPTTAPVLTPTDTEAQARLTKEQHDRFFDFNTARIALKQLETDWAAEIAATADRRATRKVDVDVKSLRESGEIGADETFIPVRIIDSNIRREQPTYINYLKNSRRIVTFDCLSSPMQDTQNIETEFTKGCTYKGWETPHFKVVDGAQTHGWDCLEVMFDSSKPLHISLEQCGHDRILFNTDTMDIQFCERIVRIYELQPTQLKAFVLKFGWSAVLVQSILDKRNTERQDKPVKIRKCFFKWEGEVWVGWYSLELGADDWLSAPSKLTLDYAVQVTETVNVPTPQTVTGEMGIPVQVITNVPTPQTKWVETALTEYPIFMLPYLETEMLRIFDHEGRVFLDEGKQEGMTATTTSFVNRMIRSQNVYGAPATDNGDGSAPKQSDLKLENGTILTKPFQFWSYPAPDPTVLRALQYLDVANSQEVGQTSFAAMNREDSRKTAKEIGAAEQQDQKISSVSLTLYSTFIRSVYTFVWKIVQSQAEQGKLPMFLLVQDAQSDSYVQDVQSIQQTYDIRAAGDTDVIRRQEIMSQMAQDWPVVQNTPLAQVFLLDYLKIRYPADSKKYEMIMQQGDPKIQLVQLVGALGSALKATLTENPAYMAKLPPEDKMKLQQLEQAAMQAMQQAQTVQPGGGGQQSTQSAQ